MTNGQLTTSDIAAMLGLSHRHVTDRLVKRADFPKPVVQVSRKTRRWDRRAVEKWMQGGKA